MTGQRRHGGRDLGGVGGERGEHPEQRLGQPQARADSLQPADENVAGREADPGGEHEGDA